MHWSQVFGNLVTAQEIVDAAAEAGQTIADYLREQYRELGEENPDAGYDQETAPDFDALADQIEREVTLEED